MKFKLNAFVSLNDTLRKAMEVIDQNSMQICFVLDENGKLAGALTDGDIRRAILKSAQLDQSVSLFMNPNPRFIRENLKRSEIIEKMRTWNVRHIPVLDAEHRVVSIETSDQLMGFLKRDNQVVLMAGGFGKRLKPLTDDLPKPLLKVGGQPILETIVKRFRDQGFYNFTFIVSYRAEMIKNYFGDGKELGVQIEYLYEETPLGTCGGLSLLNKRPELPFFVMNGDILTLANFSFMLDEHQSLDSHATMAVREYYTEVPYGVVRVDGTKIISIEKKPRELSYVNAGIYILSPEAWDQIPKQKFFDMPSLFNQLKQESASIFCHKLKDYWIDIGRMEDFHKAQTEFDGHFRR